MLRQSKHLLITSAVSALTFSASIASLPGFAQTTPPPSGQASGTDNGAASLAPGAQRTQSTVPGAPYVDALGQTTLITQTAEQNKQSVIANVNAQLLQGSELGAYNETYMGLKNFWSDDIVSNLFQNVGQLIGRWVTELINGWVSDTVQFLTAFLRIFVLNPNIAVNGTRGVIGAVNGGSDDISPFIRQAADIMYAIAVDLSLLLFILSIWRYWMDAAWRGGVNVMAAVGRLIFTSGLMLAWPTIYAFEIQITNEMIKAIFFSSADQVVMLDAAMAATVKGGLVAGAGLLASTFAPVVGSLAGGAVLGGAGGLVLGTVGEVVAFAGLIIYLVLGVVLITQLLYILVLKAIQTALLTAQYMFGPVFLVFFASPSTESLASGYVRSFVEVSLWTFCWVGLLKIMVILLFSDFNPWGKIVMGIGVLQLMISVPEFMSRARISPMSTFISAGMLTGGLMGGMKALGNAAKSRTAQAIDYQTNQKFAARGLEQSNSVALDGVNPSAKDAALLQSLKNAKKGTGGKDSPTPPTAPTSPTAPFNNPGGPNSSTKSGTDANPEGASETNGKQINQMKETKASIPPVKKAVGGAADGKTSSATLNVQAPGSGDMADASSSVDPADGGIDATISGTVGSHLPGRGIYRWQRRHVKTAPLSRRINGTDPAEQGAVAGRLVNGTGELSSAHPSTQGATASAADGSANGGRPDVNPLSAADVQPVTPPAGQSGGTAGDLDTDGALQQDPVPMPKRFVRVKKLITQKQGSAMPAGLNIGPDPATIARDPGAGKTIDPAFMQSLNVGSSGAGNDSNQSETATLPQEPTQPNHALHAFLSTGYLNVPVRDFVVGIRTAARTLGVHSAQRALVGDNRGMIQHARYNENDTDDQKAQLLAIGGFAQRFSSDPVGFDAARQSAIDAGADGPRGLGENMAAGFLAHNGRSFKQTAVAKQRFQKALMEQAVIGSHSYVSMDPSNANAYTNYLNNTYGPMTPERQAHMLYLLEEDQDTDSGWNPNRPAAVDLLTKTGVGITGSRIAAASVEGVKALAPWAKPAGVLAVSALLEQKADAHFAGQPDVNSLVRNAYIGQMAGSITPSEVSSSLALMLEAPNSEVGSALAGNETLVNVVSNLVSQGYQRDHVSAVKSLGEITQHLAGRANTQSPSISSARVVHSQGSSGSSTQSNFAPQTFQTEVIATTFVDQTANDNFQLGLPNLEIDDEFGPVPEPLTASVTGPEALVNQQVSQNVIYNTSPNYSSSALVASTPEQILHAQQIIMQAHDAGFDDRQMRVPSIARAIVDVQHEPQLLRPAAMAAAVLQPDELTTTMIRTADAMVEANVNQFTREDLIAGKSALQHNIYPDRMAIQVVRQDPNYRPELTPVGNDFTASSVPDTAIQQVQAKRNQAAQSLSKLQSQLNDPPSSSLPGTPPPPLVRT